MIEGMNVIETVEYRGFKINIYHDNCSGSPREELYGPCKMICFHDGYYLGDEHAFSDHNHFLKWLVDNNYIDGKNIFILPLYLYNNSGIEMRTGPFHCKWDPGQIGWIYVTAESFEAECTRRSRCPNRKPGKRISRLIERAYQWLEVEAKEYNDYLTGNKYGYDIETFDIECIFPYEEFYIEDSVWGFYGDDGKREMIAEAKMSIDLALGAYETADMDK